MKVMGYGLQVTVIGMLVVFFGLIILVASIGVMDRILRAGKKKSAEAKAPASAAAPAVAAPMAAPVAAPVKAASAPVAAVIAAAVAAVMAQEGVGPGGYAVRAIRRTRSIPAWNRAGREEQIYSRF
jgi:sodium pump decarboxylase gamma subunit